MALTFSVPMLQLHHVDGRGCHAGLVRASKQRSPHVKSVLASFQLSTCTAANTPAGEQLYFTFSSQVALATAGFARARPAASHQVGIRHVDIAPHHWCSCAVKCITVSLIGSHCFRGGAACCCASDALACAPKHPHTPHAEMRVYGGSLPVSWALQVRTSQQNGTSAASRALGQQQQRVQRAAARDPHLWGAAGRGSSPPEVRARASSTISMWGGLPAVEVQPASRSLRGVHTYAEATVWACRCLMQYRQPHRLPHCVDKFV